MLKCKCELISKIEWWFIFLASLDEACQKFGIKSWNYHWRKKHIQAVLIYWCFWLISFLGVCLSCMSTEWKWWHKLCQARHLIWVAFFVPNQMVQSLTVYRWLKAQGLRYQISIHESQCSLVKAASMHLISCRILKKLVRQIVKKIHYHYG